MEDIVIIILIIIIIIIILLQVHNEDNHVVQFVWHREWKFAIFQVEFTHDIWIKKWWD
jgi:hypothetical protein